VASALGLSLMHRWHQLTKTLHAIVLRAVLALPFIYDARLSFFSFQPACCTEGFAPFCRRPFPYGLALTYFSAFASVTIRLRGRLVGSVHAVRIHTRNEQQ
jgi:hypothetical protein